MKKKKSFVSNHQAGAGTLILICVLCFIWCASSELVAGREKPYVRVWADYVVVDGTPGSGITEPGASLHVISDQAPVSILDLDNTTDWLTMDFRRQGQRTASFGVSASDAYGGNAFVLGSYKDDWTNPLIIEQGAPTESLYIKSNGNISMTGDLTVNGASTNFRNAIKAVDGSGSGIDADLLDNISSGSFVQTTYNSSLNSDSRNSRGPTRLYRRESDSNYSVQTYWTGSRWRLYGYSGDTGHGDTHVGYADNADKVDGVHESSLARNIRGACRQVKWTTQTALFQCSTNEYVAGVYIGQSPSDHWESHVSAILCCDRR